jgi:acyl-CoA hydrolase
MPGAYIICRGRGRYYDGGKSIMKDYAAEYTKKVISIEEAIGKIESGMEIVLNQMGVPEGLMDQLHTIADRVSDVKVFVAITGKPFEWYLNPDMAGHFEYCSWFHGPATRAGMATNPAGVCFVPNLLHSIGPDYARARKPNIFYGSCTPPDKHGYVSIGLSCVYERSAMEKADVVVMEVNRNLPRLMGETAVHIDDVDFFVENDYMPMNIPDIEPNETDLIIGKLVADLVEDGSTIQLGIGGIPSAVGKCLTEKNDLGVHTELLGDTMMHLHELGNITNKKKSLFKDRFVCAFVNGTHKLYQWVDDNVSIRVLRGDWVNDPAVIRRNSKMVSINSCMMVDLTGQVLSEGIGTNQYSGTGGQLDFGLGAKEGLDGKGKGIIACYSTAKNGAASTIVSVPPQGTPVTLHRGISDYVVTEHGVVWLRGRTVKERAELLIGIADPKFRDQLREEAKRYGYM